MEASRDLPPKNVRLETQDATYYHFKTDVFRREVTYSSDKNIAANLVTLDPERVFEIIRMNEAGEKPATLQREKDAPSPKDAYNDLLDQDELTRFDNKRRKKKKKNGQNKGQGQANAEAQNAPAQKDNKPGPSRNKKKRQGGGGGQGPKTEPLS